MFISARYAIPIVSSAQMQLTTVPRAILMLSGQSMETVEDSALLARRHVLRARKDRPTASPAR